MGKLRLNIFRFFAGEEFVEPEFWRNTKGSKNFFFLVYYRGEVRWTFSLGCIKSIYIIYVCWKRSGYLLTFDLRSPGRSSIKYDWVELFQSWCLNNGDKEVFPGVKTKWLAKLGEEVVIEIPIEQKKPTALGSLQMVHLEGFENVTRSSKTDLQNKNSIETK